MNKTYPYDFLLVGSGLFNAIFAREATKQDKKCLVVEKRNHTGGNLYCGKVEGINVHQYGAHIFHTNNRCVWQYMNELCEFNRFVNSPLARYKNELYNLPFNMNTFYQLWGTVTPEEAKAKIEEQRSNISKPQNAEEQALSLVGNDIYEKLVKGYTEKQWGREAKELPAFIIQRIPLRFTFDNNYFDDPFQGIPIGGYNSLFEKCFKGCDMILNTDFLQNRYLACEAKTIIFTGMIDAYFDYCYGQLEYRSLCFEDEVLNTNNYQGNAVVNYTEKEISYTRIIEHKHFEFGKQSKTIITKEYPKEWKPELEPYYPINTNDNELLYQKYRGLSLQKKNVFFGGRLGTYKYFNMDQIVKAALLFYDNIKSLK